jgi:hypothetical protein
VTLSRSLRRVYHYYLGSLTDPHEARIFARDWPAINLSLGAAIRRVVRVVRPVWFRDRNPISPADNTPCVIASIDPRTDDVRFVAAGDETLGAADASILDPDGHPLPRTGEERPCSE